MCLFAKWGWKYLLVIPHSLRHQEMLNSLNQVKGLEQSLNGVNNVNAHHLKNVKHITRKPINHIQ